MELVKWDATNNEMLFGNMDNRKEPNIIPIAHTQDASEYVGLSFNTITPDYTNIVIDIPADTYYFFFSPIDGTWLTRDLVNVALKSLRTKEIENMTVEVNSFFIDANEDAQNRITRAITAMGDTDTIQWKGFDNSFKTFTKAQLKDALRQAGLKQTELWIKYSL